MATPKQQHAFYRAVEEYTNIAYIYHVWQNEADPFEGGAWNAPGAPAPLGAPAALSTPGQQHVFFRAIDGQGKKVIYHIWQDDGGTPKGEEWTADGSLEPAGDPAAVMTSDGPRHVFFLASTETGPYIYRISHDASGQNKSCGFWCKDGAPAPAGNPTALVTG